MTNPTLFLSPTAYDLHYASNPFSAFPLYSPIYDPVTPLASLCVAQLGSWAAAVAGAAGDHLTWLFSVSDCVALCGTLPPASFAVVDTSNVADHVGLLPLLVATRPLLSPGGLLLTQSLRHSSYARNVDAYLQHHLVVGPPHWPSLLGWRCLGHEGDAAAPPPGPIGLALPDVAGAVAAAMMPGGISPVRYELNLVWTPAPAPVPRLRLDTTPAVRELVRACAPPVVTTPLGAFLLPSVGRRVHLLTLLPLLATGLGGAALLSAETNWEVADVLAALQDAQGKGGRGEEASAATVLHLASVTLADGQLFGEEAPMEHEPYMLLRVGDRAMVYTGLSVTADAAPATTYTVRWLVNLSRLPGAVVEMVTNGTVLWRRPAEEVATAPLPAATVAAWATRYAPRTAGTVPVDNPPWEGLVAREDAWEVTVATPRGWATPLAAGAMARPVVQAAASGGVRLSMSAASARHADVVLQLPGPVVPGGVTVVSAAADRLTIVARKGRYDLPSRVPADLWVGDSGAWAPMVVPADVCIFQSGLQMTEEEKFVARSRPPGEVPPLLALKDTLMFLFQCSDEVLFAIQVDEAGARGAPPRGAVLLHHGLRREHRTGVIAADVSVCFLEPTVASVLSPFMQTLLRRFPLSRTIRISAGEFQILRPVVAAMAARAKDAGGVRAPSPRVVVPAPLRPHFTRVLLQPLFAKAHAPSSVHDGRVDLPTADETPVVEMQAAKDAGVRLVKAAKWGPAAIAFRRAILAHFRAPVAEQLEGPQRRLAGVTFLNLSLCLLHGAAPVGVGGGGHNNGGPGGDPSLAEAVAAAGEAADLLTVPGSVDGGALVAKAAYRKGLALERLGLLRQAAESFAQAAARLPADAAIAQAVRRVREAAGAP